MIVKKKTEYVKSQKGRYFEPPKRHRQITYDRFTDLGLSCYDCAYFNGVGEECTCWIRQCKPGGLPQGMIASILACCNLPKALCIQFRLMATVKIYKDFQLF